MTGKISLDIAKTLGRKLADAELFGKPASLSGLVADGLLPDTIEVGMSAQSVAVKAIGKDVLGWKIAVNSEGIPIAAPLLDVITAGIDGVAIVSKVGATAVEIEICYVLRDDILPPKPGTSHDRASLLEKIESVHLGAELLSSRVDADGAVPFPLFLADRLGNNCFALGPIVGGRLNAKNAVDILDCHALSVTRDGELAFDGQPNHPLGDPLEPMLKYVNGRGLSSVRLKSGQVITTGSLCGVINVLGVRTIEVFNASRSVFQVVLQPDT